MPCFPGTWSNTQADVRHVLHRETCPLRLLNLSLLSAFFTQPNSQTHKIDEGGFILVKPCSQFMSENRKMTQTTETDDQENACKLNEYIISTHCIFHLKPQVRQKQRWCSKVFSHININRIYDHNLPKRKLKSGQINSFHLVYFLVSF